MKVKNDHRSKFFNLSNWKEEAWKNQGFNEISMHRYHWGHGFQSHWSPDFFRLLLSNCLNWKIYCDDHSSLSDQLVFYKDVGIRAPSDLWGGDFLAQKITQFPNARLLKSGCKCTQIVWKTKTFTKIVLLKACILNYLYQQSQSSKI